MVTRLRHLIIHRAGSLALAALPVLAGGYAAPSRATDIEVFFTSPVTTSGVPPNVIFLLDASTSMWTPADAAAAAYDPATSYSAAGCDTNAFYYVTGSGTPSCASTKVIQDNFFCPNTKATLNSTRTQINFANKLAERWNRTSGPPASRGTQWRNLQGTENTPIICQGDEGGTRPTSTFPVNWAAISTTGISLYHGNYLAYLASVATSATARIDVMKNAVLELAQTTDGINVSLMRFGANNSLATTVSASGSCLPDRGTPPGDEASGQSGEGLIVMELLDIDAAGTVDTIKTKLYDEMVPGSGGACDVQLFTPNGRTGMATALYEAYAYLRGDPVSAKNKNLTAGISSNHNYPSVAGSRVGGTLASDRYRSPITDGCAKNYIVMLTDGTTEQDRTADTEIVKLKEPAGTGGRTFSSLVGSCDSNPELDDISPRPADCVDDLAEFMFKADTTGAIAGIQNVKTYTIGFALDDNATQNAEPLLQKTATRGGGKYYRADDAASLKLAFDDIVRSVLTDNATFTAPAVTVDAFNRTRNLDDVYVSLFGPALTYRWYGNVKKFRVNGSGDIVDAAGRPAVDPADGFLLSDSQSYWSSGVDGKDIKLGGAAEQLPAYGSRRIYSNLTGDSSISFSAAGLSNQLNALKNVILYTTAAAQGLLGIQAGDSVPYTQLVDWLYGRDVDDLNADGSTTDTRGDMGDPLHSRPVVLTYGGTAADPDITDARLFVTTNDGMLHSIETETGIERWAFMPRQLVGRARDLYYNEDTQPEDREYGLDASARLLIFDNNSNGIIEPADVDGQRDRAYLFFGMRRGGVSYFGMDVTNKDSPRLMWVKSDLPGAGQSWSTPQPARIKDGTTEKIVLVLAGGYSTQHEDTTGSPPAWQQYPSPQDSVGNRVYMIDAFTGALVWNAGLDGASGVNLGLPDMKHAIAADVRVLDLTGDGFADRLYAGDLGGRVWRFDIFNGRSATGTTEGSRLVEGGLFASLGNAGDGSPDPEDTRRFFYAVDAVPFELNGRPLVNIGIGSGHREYPATDTVTRNGFFSMRDYNRFTQLLSSQYKTSCSGETAPCHQILTESDDDLVDLTDTVGQDATDLVPETAKGWKIWLEGLGYGEKVLSEARTLRGTTFFTTYEPTPREERPDSCAINFGTNRLYVVNLVDARPVYNDDSPAVDVDGDGVADEQAADRSTELTQSGIASEVVFLFTDQLVPGTTTGQRRVFCLAGFTRCPPGLSVAPVRTYWRQRGAQ
jgi:type IV pilus assembly protein PilY1